MTINILLQFLGKYFGFGLIIYLIICLALKTWQTRLIFFPSSFLEYTPETLGLAYENVWIPILIEEGKVEKIHGWWVPSQVSRDVLLYLHGNAGNISANLGRVQRFQEMGFSVLIIDYRGYGQSQGQFPNETRVYQDSQAAWNYLVQKRAINPQNIFIYGHSLGAAIAIDLAVRQPLAAGVIAESSFTSIKALAKTQPTYQLFPINLILNQHFDSLSKLEILQIPLLLIHGLEDNTVPPQMSQILYNHAKVPKKLLFVAYAGHNNVAAVGDQDYIDTINSFRQLAKHQHTSLIK